MSRRKAAAVPERMNSDSEEVENPQEEAPEEVTSSRRGVKRGQSAAKAAKAAVPKPKKAATAQKPKPAPAKGKRAAEAAAEEPSTSRGARGQVSPEEVPEAGGSMPPSSRKKKTPMPRKASKDTDEPKPSSSRAKRKPPADEEEAETPSPAVSTSSSVSVKKPRLTPKPAEVVPYTGVPVPSDGVEPHGGTLVTWGMGELGQLGLGRNVLEKRRPARVKAGTKFTHLAPGALFTLAIEATPTTDSDEAPKSRIVGMGCNDEYAVGAEVHEEDEAFVPQYADLSSVPAPFKVAKLVAGDTHGAALTHDGRVYVWGVFRGDEAKLGLRNAGEVQKFPAELDLTRKARRKGNAVDEKRFIVNISSGCAHLIMLSRSGEAYTMGGFYAGQLGRIPERFLDLKKNQLTAEVLAPTPVKFAPPAKKTPFDAVFATTAGSFFREKGTGKLFACGLNRYGQLGVSKKSADEDLQDFVSPCDLINEYIAKNDPGCLWVKVAGGRDHTLLLADNGKLYAIGHIFVLGVGDGAGLDLKGEGDHRFSDVPILLNSRFPGDAKDGHVVEIGAGDVVSLAIVEEPAESHESNGNGHQEADGAEKKRFLVSWGLQTTCQLARNTEDDSPEPELVNLGSVVPLKIAVGGQHAAALVRETKQELQ